MAAEPLGELAHGEILAPGEIDRSVRSLCSMLLFEPEVERCVRVRGGDDLVHELPTIGKYGRLGWRTPTSNSTPISLPSRCRVASGLHRHGGAPSQTRQVNKVACSTCRCPTMILSPASRSDLISERHASQPQIFQHSRPNATCGYVRFGAAIGG